MMRGKAFAACLAHCLAMAALLFVSCRPSVPDVYIQPDELEDILYDYHLAEGIAQQRDPNDTLAVFSFKANILKSHNVSEAEFDSSMVYYTRHTKLLQDIYESLADRLSDEAEGLGATVSDMKRYGDLASSSDTADVWNGERAFVLSPYPALDQYSFEIEADTAFHAGDKMMLDFDAQFIYQDGMRDGVAVLAVKYENDSVESRVMQISTTSHFHVQTDNGAGLKIKSVKGFFLLNNDINSSSSTTLRIMIVSGIKLVRMHVSSAAEKNADGQNAGKADSASTRGGSAPSDSNASGGKVALPGGELKRMPLEKMQVKRAQ